MKLERLQQREQVGRFIYLARYWGQWVLFSSPFRVIHGVTVTLFLSEIGHHSKVTPVAHTISYFWYILQKLGYLIPKMPGHTVL